MLVFPIAAKTAITRHTKGFSWQRGKNVEKRRRGGDIWVLFVGSKKLGCEMTMRLFFFPLYRLSDRRKGSGSHAVTRCLKAARSCVYGIPACILAGIILRIISEIHVVDLLEILVIFLD